MHAPNEVVSLCLKQPRLLLPHGLGSVFSANYSPFSTETLLTRWSMSATGDGIVPASAVRTPVQSSCLVRFENVEARLLRPSEGRSLSDRERNIMGCALCSGSHLSGNRV